LLPNQFVYNCRDIEAIVRLTLWDLARVIDRKTHQSNGTIIAAITKGERGGDAYDREYPERLKATIY
jgi:hypothetical protein